METGKTRRMRRIFRKDGKTVIIPMDHGVSVGPIQGLHDMTDTVSCLVKGGADAILIHAGIAKTVDNSDTGLIVHLSGATRLTGDPNWKTQLTSVREAVRLGADAISVHINVGSQHEQEMLQSFSHISDECEGLGIPTLAMMYPRGPAVSNEHSFEAVSHAARLGYEIGADIVKTNYTGSVDSFQRVVQSVKVPVVVAGGPRVSKDSDVLSMVAESITAGAAGVSIGRNVFQHENPSNMTNAIVSIVHGNKSFREAESLLGGSK
jgi:fructose-bisphosphate aldolase / 2-amino-3,7-dideoxy-D-threo-hept-6-ulosonate synthase